MTAPLGAAARLVIDGREPDGTLYGRGPWKLAWFCGPPLRDIGSKLYVLILGAQTFWMVKVPRLCPFALGHTMQSMNGLTISVSWEYFLGVMGALIAVAYYTNGRLTGLETSVQWLTEAVRELVLRAENITHARSGG
jgi:hypothetical protein